MPQIWSSIPPIPRSIAPSESRLIDPGIIRVNRLPQQRSDSRISPYSLASLTGERSWKMKRRYLTSATRFVISYVDKGREFEWKMATTCLLIIETQKITRLTVLTSIFLFTWPSFLLELLDVIWISLGHAPTLTSFISTVKMKKSSSHFAYSDLRESARNNATVSSWCHTDRLFNSLVIALTTSI